MTNRYVNGSFVALLISKQVRERSRSVLGLVLKMDKMRKVSFLFAQLAAFGL